jgi:fermentation-respiration switch protein FrsA (DUF1100 family)
MSASRSTKLGSALLRGLVKGLRLITLSYLGVLLLFLFLENRLLYPAPRYPVGDWVASHLPHEDVYFTSADGTKLHGWFVEHPRPRAVVLYCHGNGEHVAYNAELLAMMRDDFRVSIFAFDYRGYGRSEGEPFETGILEDAEAAQAWLAERTGVAQHEIVLMGRSIGGGVAVHLAAKNGAGGLILESTFSSVPDAAGAQFPWLPVRWLMKNRYDSVSKIGGYDGPLLQSHGESDTLVPMEMGRKLFDAARGPKEFYCVSGGDHNCLQPAEYYQKLDEFLERLANAERPASDR